MKKLLFILGGLTISINAYILNLQSGWQLKGALEDINISSFKKDGIVSVWTYDLKNAKWKAYFPYLSIDLNKYGIENLNNINKEEGFWVKSSKNLSIDISKSWMKVDELNGTFYGVNCLPDVQVCLLDGIVKVDIANGNILDAKTGEIWDNIAKLDDFTLFDKDIDEEKGYYDKFLKVNNHIEIYKSENKNGEYQKDDYILFSSLTEAQNYLDNMNTGKGVIKVTNFNEIKGKVFYELDISDEDKISVDAFRINNEKNASKYYMDYNGVDELKTDLSDSAFDYYVNIKFDENGTFSYYNKDENKWESNNLYKISLIGKTYTIDQLASEYMWNKEDLKTYFNFNHLPTTFHFTKGNMYCRMLWWECWFDKDAMDDLISQINQ